MTPLDQGIVSSVNSEASGSVQVAVSVWQDSSTYLGDINVEIPKSSVPNPAGWRSAYVALSDAILSGYGYSSPANGYWDAFDGETVPASRVTGLASVATSGSYADLSGTPAIPNTTRATSTLSLSLVGTGAIGTQISATKDSSVKLTVSTSTTSTIGGPSTSAVALKVCATNSATEANWTTVAVQENDQTITLAIILNSIQLVKGQLCADVQAGWYVKLVNTGSGTHSEAFVSGQQTIYG